MSPKKVTIHLPFGRTDITLGDAEADALVDALSNGKHASIDRSNPGNTGKTVFNPAHVSMIETTDVP